MLRYGLSLAAGMLSLAGCPTGESTDEATTNAGTSSSASEGATGSGSGSGSTDAGTGPESSSSGADSTTVSDDGSSSSSSSGEPSEWRCLGAVEPPAWSDGSATVRFTVASFPEGGPIAAVDLLVCGLDDTDCMNPLDQGTTDAEGRVDVDVGTDAPYYFDLTGGGLAPSLFFRRGLPPPTDPFDVELGALTENTLGLFFDVVGVRSDPTRGHVVITARDCDAMLAPGVRVEIDTADGSSTLVYLDGGLPSVEAVATDTSGRAGALNLPGGPVVVTAYRADTDEYIGEREIFIRPSEVSFVGVIPSM